MASRKENLKSLFSNTRTRVIIVFTIVLMVLAVTIGYFKFRSVSEAPGATAEVATAPGSIQSIPGVLEPTVQYAKLQEEQNLAQAQKAVTSGGSAIPTIIKTQALGEGVGVIGSQTGVGFSALVRGDEEGAQQSLWLEELKNSNCSKSIVTKVVSQGAQLTDLKKACTCVQLKDVGYVLKDLEPVCDCKELKAAGFNASQMKEIGYSARQLKDCGFSACETRNAPFAAQDMKNGGYSDGELKGAGFSDNEIAKAKGISDEDIRKAGCDAEALTKLRQAGISAAEIRRVSGCTSDQLKAAGYSEKEVLEALNVNDCSVDSLKRAKAAGVSAKTIKETLGCSAKAMKDAGYSAKELKDAGYTAAELKEAGFSAAELAAAGFKPEETTVAGLQGPPVIPQVPSTIAGVPGHAATSTEQLQTIISKQNVQMAEQKNQQKIQQRTSEMVAAANQALQDWKKVTTQIYTSGNEEKGVATEVVTTTTATAQGTAVTTQSVTVASSNEAKVYVKTGDIYFAVLDTSIDSDEPGPILATIVSGKLKGSKLIGSFNLPANAEKMVINFNTLSVPGAPKTISISAFAIDPNTARTALSSRTDHHYLMRYGSLFASSFLEGFGNAFQSANTTVTIGGTGGGNDITVSNGVGRSTLENAVIGLATVGKSWGQQAQQNFNTPITVHVYSGTGIGVLFTQDVAIS